MPKPVQIFLKPEGPGAPIEVFLALCDDGSIWWLPRPFAPPRPDQKWQPLPDVPVTSCPHHGGGEDPAEALPV